MSIKAKLHIDDRIVTILNFSFSLEQKTDYIGHPSSSPTGGIFRIVLETTRDNLFFEWMVNNNMKNLKIVLSPTSMSSRSRIIELFDVYCLKHIENFDGVIEKPMSTFLEVSPAIMIDSGVKIFEKYWKVSDLSSQNVAPTVISQEEPEVVDCYYTDLEGNEQAEPTIGEEVYLVLQTENAVGKTIDIDLSNHTKDFIYNDEVIENDIIKDFSITSDLHKIKLRIIAEQEGEIEKIQK